MTDIVARDEAVRVTAADFNGSSWDGCPFSAVPKWLADAVDSKQVRPVTPGSTDYAEWEVDTAKGTILAGPGDWIAVAYRGRLIVLREVAP